jgi:phosphoribosyl-ATP pyrophosphohydrolase
MCPDPTVLRRLMDVIQHRKANRPGGSYTVRLLDGGVEAIGAKVCEEAGELVEAARRAGQDGGRAAVHEAADLLYHVLVMLGHCGVDLADVESELARRFGTSGLQEKSQRAGRRQDEEFPDLP